MPPFNTVFPSSLFVSLARGGGRMRAQDEEVCCKVYAISDGAEERWNCGVVRFYGPFRFTFLIKNPRPVVTLFRKSWTE